MTEKLQVTHRSTEIVTRDERLIAVPASKDVPEAKMFRNDSRVNAAFRRMPR